MLTGAATQDQGEPAPGGTLPPCKDEECVCCGGQIIEVLPQVFDTRFGVPGEYAICKCSECGLEQILPRPSADELQLLYATYYNFGGERDTTYTRWREWFLASWLYRLWLWVDGDGSFHGRKGTGRLLDVGCNEGRGLKIFRRNGFLPEGLELNPRAAAVARAAGFRVQEVLIEDFHPSEGYDIVVLSNVLEHSLDPKRMLLDIARVLKPGGQVWIACPNSRSWLRSIFGRAWINWHAPFHISHFSSQTLRSVLRQTGFVQIELRQITPALWVASSAITSLFSRPRSKTKQLRNPLLVLTLMILARLLFFPLLYIGNRVHRGDCLIVTASVPGAAAH